MDQRRITKRCKRAPQLPSFKPSDILRKSIQNQTYISLQITKQILLNEEFSGKNIVFSPLSIQVILSMIVAGSSGENLEEKLKFLKLKSVEEVSSLASEVFSLVFADGSQEGGPLLSFVNGVLIDESLGIKDSYQNVVETLCGAVVKQVDFKKESEKVQNEVNSWSEKQTNGWIKSIFPADTIDSEAKLILTNALYFKGEWNKGFHASQTKNFNFHLLNNAGTVQVPYMTKTSDQYISKFEDFKVLKLPYKQGNDYDRKFSMYIFLPNKTNGLPALIDQICSNSEFIENHIPKWKVSSSTFIIPKFKISFDFEASKLLQSLGFCGEGLTEIIDSSLPVEVSKILHKSFIEVNESGAEVDYESSGYSQERIFFLATHPFLYLVREEVTKTILCIGQVLNPVQE